MTPTDKRFDALKQWLSSKFQHSFDCQLISGDASFRRYFRIKCDKESFIAVDSPPNLVPISPFLALDKEYANLGLKVPDIYEFDIKQGFMLLSDLGSVHLGQALNEKNVLNWYQQALSLLPKVMALSDTADNHLAIYDKQFIATELNIFIEWLLQTHLELNLDSKTQDMLANTFTILIDSALAQPRAGMHRDFHSRNIMLKEQKLYLIDFQDSVIGPITYDAVSLLRDCYIRWPIPIVEQLMQYHFQLLLDTDRLPANTDFLTYQRWFDLMGLQRHLKAAGIFARLYHRDNKTGYLKDIPLTLEYISDVSSKYIELKPFHQWIKHVLLPAFKQRKLC